MKTSAVVWGIAAALALLLSLRPACAEEKKSPPPISQSSVREGTYAARLLSDLGVGTAEDEVEAETKLGDLGILPRNGWIADYPMTPDIIAEVRQAVTDAADEGHISLSKEEALRKVDGVDAALGLAIRPYAEETEEKPPSTDSYPTPTVINNYYYEEGPPVVTYYSPPPDFYYLYAWVPFPFWWAGFWFPGYYILNDFHRVVVVDHHVRYISNHFNDVHRHRVFRIDPVRRFHGRTFAGIGATGSRNFISTGVPQSPRRIFNSHRPAPPPESRFDRPSRGRSLQTPTRSRGFTPGGGRSFTPGGARPVPPQQHFQRGGGGGGGQRQQSQPYRPQRRPQ